MPAPALIPPAVHFITLGVQDMVAMRQFYERLGMRADKTSTQDVVFFLLNGIVLCLFGQKALAEDAGLPLQPPSAFRGLALAWNGNNEAEVDLILQQAKAAGAKIVKPAAKTFWGGYAGYFSDPEDNLWETAYNPCININAHQRVDMGA